MDITDIHPLIEDLSSNIDELEDSLQPLLTPALATNASKLPLLDQAKLYVLATYTLESLLFSSLRVAGVSAKEHPVFHELARVKQYFAKIKTAETAGTKRSSTLDKEAAGRFIKHGLAGNEQYDRERAEKMARERAGAKRKLEDMRVGTHTRFDGAAKRIKASEGEAASERNTSENGSPRDEDMSMSELSQTGKKSKTDRRREREEGASQHAQSTHVQNSNSGGGTTVVEPMSDITTKGMEESVHQGLADTSESKRRKKNRKKKDKSLG